MSDVLPQMATEAEHVVMLLNNPCINDSRVIKSAQALVLGGWRVTVVCRHQGSLPVIEENGGVTYHRLGPLPHDVRSMFIRLKDMVFPKSIYQTTDFSSEMHSVNQSRSMRDKFHSVCPVCIRSLISRVWIRISQLSKKVKLSSPNLRKFKRLLTLPVRMLYWMNETDEFKNIAFRHALSLKPDVVHCHDLATLPAGVAIAQASRCKLVYDSHELEMHRNAKYPRFVEHKRRKLEKFGISKTDAVITVSESIADHLKQDYKIPRPYVVMNAPDFDGYTSVRNLREDIGLPSDAPLAVYVGSVTINRGIDYVVRSLQHNSNLHFATVGPRRPATQVEIHELAIKLGVADRVHFVDPVPPNDVVSYIRTADISVLPIQNVCLSYYYCMPNKLLESVFAGIPVAVADLVEMRRFVEAYQCGLVMDQTDPESIASAISKVIASRNSYVLPVEKRLELTEKYSWTTQANHLREIYSKFKMSPSTEDSRKVAA